jgi:hypothetical protein
VLHKERAEDLPMRVLASLAGILGTIVLISPFH